MRLRERFSLDDLPDDLRELAEKAEAEIDFGEPHGGYFSATMRCVVRPNAAWVEFERLMGVH